MKSLLYKLGLAMLVLAGATDVPVFAKLDYDPSKVVPSYAKPEKCGLSGGQIPDWSLLNPALLAGVIGEKNKSEPKIKSVKDFVCCLPAELTGSYIVGQNSFAAQNGKPNDPRVIMFKKAAGGEGLDMAVSLNSGAHGMSQAESLEVMFRNKQTGQLEFYDMDFSTGRAVLGPKNPEKCMTCHAGPKETGPRPIFENDPHWPTFVGGAMKCSPEEDKANKIASDASVKALDKNPQYDCLDKSMFSQPLKPGQFTAPQGMSPLAEYGQARQKVVEFDSAINKNNNFRVGKILRGSAGYQKYKYFMIAQPACGGKLNEWLPEETLGRLKANINLREDLREPADLKSGTTAAYNKELVKVEELQRSLASKSEESIQNDGFQPINNSVACNERQNKVTLSTFLSSQGFGTPFGGGLNGGPTTDDYVKRLRIDNALSGTMLLGGLDPAARMFYEGNGMNMQDLMMSAAPDPRSGFPDLGRSRLPLITLELQYGDTMKDYFTENAPPGELSQQNSGIIEGGKRFFFKDGTKNEFCAKFKKLSMDALSAPSPSKDERDSPPPVIDR